jgi:hypothetical protein
MKEKIHATAMARSPSGAILAQVRDEEQTTWLADSHWRSNASIKWSFGSVGT